MQDADQCHHQSDSNDHHRKTDLPEAPQCGNEQKKVQEKLLHDDERIGITLQGQ